MKPLVSGIADERQPIVGARVDAGDLIGAFALAFASFKDPHIVPQGKQIEVGLQGVQIAKSPVMVQELLQQTIDVLNEAAGATGGIKQAQQAISQWRQIGEISPERLEGRFRFLSLRLKLGVTIEESLP